jgi:arylsulfatase A-like enzyme
MSVWDILPTLAAAAGIDVLNDEEQYPLDGRNVWEELRGKVPEMPADEYLVVGSRGWIAFFDEQWKLIVDKEGVTQPGEAMLFEIEQSPSEDEDVAELYPDVVEAMRERIEEMTRDVMDQL